MKAINRTFIAIFLMACLSNLANAQSTGGLEEILGGIFNGIGRNSSPSDSKKNNGGSNTIGNLLEGVFSSSNLSVADIAGQWNTNGPAVCFKSDNLLKKAGGIAAAAMIEKEMAGYYQQYGLNGCPVTIGTDGSFSMKLSFMTLRGTVVPTSEKGVFDFAFTAFGSFKLGSIKCYAQKSYKSLNLMFDATKFKTLVSAIAKLTGNKLATTLGTLLDSYEGLCVGFRLDKTGNAPVDNNGENIFNPSGNNSNNTSSSNYGKNSNIGTGNNTGTGNSNNKNTSGSSGLDSLIQILRGGR